MPDNIARRFRRVIAAADLYHDKAQPPLLWPEPYSEDTPEAVFRFLNECCWTYNEADRSVELIPQADYIRLVVDLWHAARAEAQTLIVEKSRRMLLSWVLRGCELWSLGMSREKGLVCGLDYDKAAEHVWRIWWLHDQLRLRRPNLNLPPVIPRGGNPAAQQLNQVLLPNGSLVETLNQDGLAFQGSGYSWVAMEEFSRYRNVDFMFGQAIRVTEGKPGEKGGNVVIVTNASSNKSWQEIKKPHPNLAKSAEEPIPGTNVQDLGAKRVYARIHYSADPEKTPAWAAAERARVPSREWFREMEMKEDVYEGEPVFADYDDDKHQLDIHIPILKGGLLFGGWDCGNTLNPAFVLLRVSPRPWQVIAHLEVLAPGPEPMHKFCPRVLREIQRLLPGRWDDVEHWGDATIAARNGANGETSRDAARRHGVSIRPASLQYAAARVRKLYKSNNL